MLDAPSYDLDHEEKDEPYKRLSAQNSNDIMEYVNSLM